MSKRNALNIFTTSVITACEKKFVILIGCPVSIREPLRLFAIIIGSILDCAC